MAAASGIERGGHARGGGDVSLGSGAGCIASIRCWCGPPIRSGLFWASFRVPVGAEYFYLPAADGKDDWPALHPGGEAGAPHSQKPGDDFAGVRAYVPGESLRHVDWKAYRARAAAFGQAIHRRRRAELWLDAAEMGRLPLEARLSQLALWIVNAEKEEIPYALRLGRDDAAAGPWPGPGPARAGGAGRGGRGGRVEMGEGREAIFARRTEEERRTRRAI